MRLCSISFALLALAGCSASSSTGTFTSGAGGGGGSAQSTTSSASATSGSTGVGGVDFGTDGGVPSDGGNPNEVAEVFAHGPNTLYKLDPLTKVLTTVGNFSGCSGVIDIAIDKNGVMFGTTFGGLYKIDKATAICSHIADGSYPNSLSFVPEGTVDPAAEALVGYVGGTYVRIDTQSGQITTIGALGGGYSSSGDIVSVIGGGTYLTVNGNNCGDCIVEVDPKTGALKKNIGALGFSAVYGLAFWGGSAYGFDNWGDLFQIDLATAQSTAIPFPNAPPGLGFYGAGSSTSAPLVPPS